VSPVQVAESADGTPIAYRASGRGEPILFVHGAATSGADWLFVLPRLRERFSVVTMDRRGRGRSGDGPEYGLEREADDIVAVLDAVGGELLVGHSYGGLCSMSAAAKTDRLRRLVLYEPPIAIKGALGEDVEQLLAERGPDKALEGFLRGAGAPEEQLEQIRSSPAWPVLLDAVPMLPRELEAGSRWQPPAEPVQVPTLFILGADTAAPVYFEGLDEVQAAFPGSRRVSIPGQQHIAHVFAAAEFAEIVAEFCAQDQA
jgi:pimeloyl-ACP methyl ester carboxylesterase